MGRTGGEVTDDGGLTIGYRDNTERRVTEKSSRFWAGELQGGEFGEIYWQGGGQSLHGGDRERRNWRRTGESISFQVMRTRQMDKINGKPNR